MKNQEAKEKKPKEGPKEKRGNKPARKSKIHGSPFSIVFEDKDILVVNKQAGILTVPIPGKYSKNLEELIQEYLTPQKKDAFTVHRIDRFTSGLVVFAKGRKAWSVLVEQFKAHTPERVYLALVRGDVKKDSGEARHLMRLTKDGFRQLVVKREGTPAILRYKVAERFGEVTLMEVALETGLKNQIRVQLREMGHPLVGDRHYSPEEADEQLLGRQALHSHRLGFRHPVTGKQVVFEAPLPRDMANLVEKLRNKKLPKGAPA